MIVLVQNGRIVFQPLGEYCGCDSVLEKFQGNDDTAYGGILLGLVRIPLYTISARVQRTARHLPLGVLSCLIQRVFRVFAEARLGVGHPFL